MKLVIVILNTALMWYGAEGADYNEYQNLVSAITLGYSTNVRPFRNSTVPTNVTLSLDLLSIVEVKEKDQSLVTNAKLIIAWQDNVLQWSTASNGNISSLLLPQTQIWRPDIVLKNPVSTQGLLGHKDLLVLLYNTGDVEWTPTGVFKTSCSIDITYYPMDTQKCSIIFQPEMSGSNDIHLYVEAFSLEHFTENGQWQVKDYAAYNSLQSDGVQVVEFQLKLHRRRFFYVLNVILPVVFLSLTSSLVFALPADAGEKMGLSITILLAYAVYLTLVTDSMPNTSMQVSLVAVYLMLLLGLCSINVVLTVFILRLYHCNDSRPIRHRAARLVIKVRRLLRFSDARNESSSVSSSSSSDTTDVVTISVASVEDFSDEERGSSKPTRTTKALSKNRHGPGSRRVAHRSAPAALHRSLGAKSLTSKSLNSKGKSLAEAPRPSKRNSVPYLEEPREGLSVTWKVVAETLDFLLFVVSSVISLATTILCLLTLIGGSATNAIDTSLA